MKIFNKLVNILFDEQEEEIPVITKSSTEKKEPKKTLKEEKDEVVVTKVERPVSSSIDDDLFDMPKFKEQTELEKENTKTFNFPAIDDDDFGVFEEKRSIKKEKVEKKDRKENSRFDFLSSTDYKRSDEFTKNRNNIYDASYSDDKDKKPFTLSPIISPVYGILNENYKKEDIVVTGDTQEKTNNRIDLDEVRKKAYGSLEDEISESLSKEQKQAEEKKDNSEDKLIDTLSDEGISIDDLLGDEYNSSEEVFNDDEVIPAKTEEISDKEVTDDSEDDLFDLIDSIYSGKDNE